MTPTRLVLFDIDGTLVLTGGAGKRAMDRAFEEAFGIGNAFADIAMGGRTDRFLIERGLEHWGIPATGAALDLFRRRYLAHLADGIHEPGLGRKGTMPGVGALLNALDAQPQVQLALLTGNYAAGARIKLDHFGLIPGNDTFQKNMSIFRDDTYVAKRFIPQHKPPLRRP